MIEVKNLSKQFKAPTEEKGLFGPKKKAFFLGPNNPFSSVGALNCFDKFFTSIIFESS